MDVAREVLQRRVQKHRKHCLEPRDEPHRTAPFVDLKQNSFEQESDSGLVRVAVERCMDAVDDVQWPVETQRQVVARDDSFGTPLLNDTIATCSEGYNTIQST